YEMTYAASFGGWIELRDRSVRHAWQRDLLAVGAAEPADGASAQAALPRTTLAPLPFAHAEITQIETLFPRDRVRALFNGAANKATLAAANRSGELAGYRFVHFATHAQVEPAFAERAALVLAPSSGRDSLLTATELAGFSMNAQLVVLSACDTGVGRFEPG